MPHSGNHRSCSRLCLSRAPWRCWVWPLLELVQRIVAARPKELSPRERFVLFRQLHPETGGAALFWRDVLSLTRWRENAPEGGQTISSVRAGLASSEKPIYLQLVANLSIIQGQSSGLSHNPATTGFRRT